MPWVHNSTFADDDLFADIPDTPSEGEQALAMLHEQAAKKSRQKIKKRLQRLVLERGLNLSTAKSLWSEASLKRLGTVQGGVTAQRKIEDKLTLLEQTLPPLTSEGVEAQKALVRPEKPLSRAQRA